MFASVIPVELRFFVELRLEVLVCFEARRGVEADSLLAALSSGGLVMGGFLSGGDLGVETNFAKGETSIPFIFIKQ